MFVDAVDPAVVHADEVAVGGEADVALQPLGALVQRLDVGAERVLSRDVAGPPVSDHLRAADDSVHRAHSGRQR